MSDLDSDVVARRRRNNLFDTIRDIADPEYLDKAWSGNLPGVLSSFEEISAQIYDDFDLEEHIASGARDLRLRDDQFELLCRFHDKYEAFYEHLKAIGTQHPSEKQVLADAEWYKVMAAARAFVQTLSEEDFDLS